MRHKPSFRRAFAGRRALVFADLFYEWQVVAGAKHRQPWCLRLEHEAPFALAALWERWHDPVADAALETFTLITTEPNAVVARIHDRMPVILAPDDYAAWLDISAPLDHVEALLAPYHAQPMRAVAVSTRVNSPRVDGPECVTPIEWPSGEEPTDAPARDVSPDLFSAP